MEDRRAHERITNLEGALERHLEEHSLLEDSLKENTRLTQEVANNTSELVALVKGLRGLRAFFFWVAPIVAVWAAVMTYFKKG